MATRYSLVLGQEADRQRIPVPDDRVFTIGRGGDNELILPSALVSSHHAEIRSTPEGIQLRDVGSRNGTYLNGTKLSEPRTLCPGDKILIGGSAFVFAAEDLSEAQVTLLEAPRAGKPEVFASIDTGATVIQDERHRRETFQALARAQRNLAVLHEMGGILLEVKEEGELANRLLDLVFDVVPADRACVILRRPDGTLDTKVARSREKGRTGVQVSRTILDRALVDGVSLLTSDATVDERFRDGHSVAFHGIRAAMCAPLRGKRSLLGAIYVDTKLQTAAFTPDDLEVLTTLGIQGGVAMENLRLLVENLRSARLAAVGAVIAGLGHDIRNILTALSGGEYMMNALVKDSPNADLRDAWLIVKESTATITELVNDMVSFSRDRAPDRRPVELAKLVETVANRFRPRAEAKGGRLLVLVSREAGTANVDSTGIDRVLSNLVVNALDAWSGPGGSAAIRVDGEPERIRIEVEDDGVGIPPENRERIFDLLFSTKGSKGTGFGLAITKKIVGEHGGTISVDSVPGQGSRFTVVLPRG